MGWGRGREGRGREGRKRWNKRGVKTRSGKNEIRKVRRCEREREILLKNHLKLTQSIFTYDSTGDKMVGDHCMRFELTETQV